MTSYKRELSTWQRIAVLPHIYPDGDTIGSCIALARGLRSTGLHVFVVLSDALPESLKYLNTEAFISPEDFWALKWEKESYAAYSIDGSDLTRIADRLDIWDQAGHTVCIDHHKTNEFYSKDNIVNSEASSTGEMVLKFLEDNDLVIDSEMAEALYAAISTDTGSFKYSNTTPTTHRSVAKLMEIGFDFNRSNVELYQNKPMDRITLLKIALNHLELHKNGKIGVSYITRADVEEAHVTDFDTDGICEAIRDISGLEVAVFLKESQVGQFKISMRSKHSVDVAEVSLLFGGGGHAKAAGCTIAKPVNEAMSELLGILMERV